MPSRLLTVEDRLAKALAAVQDSSKGCYGIGRGVCTGCLAGVESLEDYAEDCAARARYTNCLLQLQADMATWHEEPDDSPTATSLICAACAPCSSSGTLVSIALHACPPLLNQPTTKLPLVGTMNCILDLFRACSLVAYAAWQKMCFIYREIISIFMLILYSITNLYGGVYGKSFLVESPVQLKHCKIAIP